MWKLTIVVWKLRASQAEAQVLLNRRSSILVLPVSILSHFEDLLPPIDHSQARLFIFSTQPQRHPFLCNNRLVAFWAPRVKPCRRLDLPHVSSCILG
ncbi:hypothetical protein HDV62DRAFT_232373 [Trichoderma sp. SZMC 28011]